MSLIDLNGSKTYATALHDAHIFSVAVDPETLPETWQLPQFLPRCILLSRYYRGDISSEELGRDDVFGYQKGDWRRTTLGSITPQVL